MGAILLDAGGVFLLPNLDDVRAALGDCDFEQVRHAHHVAMRALDAAGPRQHAYWSTFPRALGANGQAPPLEELEAIRWTTVIAESVAALESLSRRGPRLAIVSNADGRVEHDLLEYRICHRDEGPATRVDAILDSTVVGFEKPDPRIFKLALEKLEVPPERAVHVGDSVRMDVGGARAAGVRPLHLDPFGMCGDTDHEHVRSLSDLL
ncbi:MAG TPA: HAD-IA family hydrolase [Candidatus Dormibacteraeota bacterium]